jgi:type VI secretion system ImpM family protein
VSLSRLATVGYGKVPCDPEFFRLESQPGLSVGLRRWVDAGHEDLAVKKRQAEADERGPVETAAFRFGLTMADSQDFLVGEIRPSRDKAGRNFPITLAAVVPLRPFGRCHYLVPFAFRDVWREISRTLDSFGGAESSDRVRGGFSDLVLGLPVTLRKIRKQFLQRLSDEKLASINGGSAAPDGGWTLPGVLGNMGQSLQPFLRSGSDDLGLGLSIPLSGGMERSCLQASFWAQFVSRAVKSKRLAPNMFLPAPDPVRKGSGDLLLLYREVGPGEYSWLLGGVGERAFHDMKAQNPPPAMLEGKVPIEAPDAALIDLLKAKWAK